MRRSLIVFITFVAAGAFAFIILRSNDVAPRKKDRPGPAPSGELSIAYPEEPATLNPYLFEGDTNATRDLVRPLLPTLLTIQPDLTYRPGLAVRVPRAADLSKDPFSITFNLDPKADWSDGTPITAADVRFTWEVIKDTAFPIADRSGYDRLTDVEVLGAHRLRLVFDRPFASWRDLFSAGDFILPKHALTGKDFTNALSDQMPVSGGPYLLESWTKGLEIVYAANSKWWGKAARTKRVHVLFVPDTEIALRLLGNGRLNAIVTTTRLNLEARAGGVSNAKVASRFGSSWWELALNHSAPPIVNPGAREAIARSIDRVGIAEAFIRGDGRKLQHLSPGRTVAGEFSTYTKDTAGAKRVAGKPGKLILIAPAENSLAGILTRSIQKGLRDTGFEVEIRAPQGTDLYATWRREGRFDIALWERRGTGSMSLRGAYGSVFGAPKGVNYSHLKSPEVDAALDAADATLTIDPLMKQLGRAIPALPIFESKMYWISRGLSGATPNASIDGPFWNLGEVSG